MTPLGAKNSQANLIIQPKCNRLSSFGDTTEIRYKSSTNYCATCGTRATRLVFSYLVLFDPLRVSLPSCCLVPAQAPARIPVLPLRLDPRFFVLRSSFHQLHQHANLHPTNNPQGRTGSINSLCSSIVSSKLPIHLDSLVRLTFP